MILCVYRLNHSISRSLVSWLLCILFIRTRQSKQLANRYYYFTFFFFLLLLLLPFSAQCSYILFIRSISQRANILSIFFSCYFCCRLLLQTNHIWNGLWIANTEWSSGTGAYHLSRIIIIVSKLFYESEWYSGVDINMFRIHENINRFLCRMILN